MSRDPRTSGSTLPTTADRTWWSAIPRRKSRWTNPSWLKPRNWPRISRMRAIRHVVDLSGEEVDRQRFHDLQQHATALKVPESGELCRKSVTPGVKADAK